MSWFSVVAIIGTIWFAASLAMGMFVGSMIRLADRIESRGMRHQEDVFAPLPVKGETVSA